MSTEIRRLLEKWRKESVAWQRGIGDNQNTRLLMECADELEALLASPPGQEAPQRYRMGLGEGPLNMVIPRPVAHPDGEWVRYADLAPSGLPPVDAQGHEPKLLTVIKIAEEIGYGNVLEHVAAAWQAKNPEHAFRLYAPSPDRHDRPEWQHGYQAGYAAGRKARDAAPRD